MKTIELISGGNQSGKTIRMWQAIEKALAEGTKVHTYGPSSPLKQIKTVPKAFRSATKPKPDQA